MQQDQLIGMQQQQNLQIHQNTIAYSPVSPNKSVEACLAFWGSVVNCCGCFKPGNTIIKEGRSGLLSINGIFQKKVLPGQYLVNPHTENLIEAELKT